MSDEVLEALTPIGLAGAPTLSTTEKARRVQRSRANRDARNVLGAHIAVTRAAREAKARRQLGTHYRQPLDIAEAVGMVSTLAEQFYRASVDVACPECQGKGGQELDGHLVKACEACRGRGDLRRADDKKQAAVSWGVVMDKWTILRAVADPRPASDRDLRPGLRELIRRLAGLGGEQPPTAATSVQP